jgi:hypothetical protein
MARALVLGSRRLLTGPGKADEQANQSSEEQENGTRSKKSESLRPVCRGRWAPVHKRLIQLTREEQRDDSRDDQDNTKHDEDRRHFQTSSFMSPHATHSSGSATPPVVVSKRKIAMSIARMIAKAVGVRPRTKGRAILTAFATATAPTVAEPVPER